MADGSIEFSTTLDNSDLEKNLKAAEKKIDNLKRKLESKTSERNAVKEQIEEADREIDRTKSNIESLKSRLEELKASGQTYGSGGFDAVNDELSKAYDQLAKQIDAAMKLDAKYSELEDEVGDYTERLQEAEREYDRLGNAAMEQASQSRPLWQRAANGMRTAFSSVAEFARQRMANAANRAAAPWQSFGKRVNTLLRKAFTFGLALKGISALKNAISDMLSENVQLQASIANLKSVAGGFLASVVGAVAPLLIQAANTFAAAFERIASFIDTIFGTNIVASIQDQRQKASDAIQQENAKKRAEYEEQLAKAQEKQAKSAKSLAREQEKANRQLLGFDEINALSAESSEDATDAMDDYTDAIDVPEMATDWTQNLGGLADFGLFQNILGWLDMIRDRILNDVEGPFARIREGLGLIKTGIGEIVQGIMTGDWALVWKGFGDVVIGALYVIEGAFGAFMDWLNEMTGGQFSDIFEGAKLVVHGFVEFVEGLLRGDLELALKGLHDFVDGLAQLLGGLVDAVMGGIIWLVESAFDWLKGGVSAFFDFLSERFPELAWLFDGMKTVVLAVIDVLQGKIVGVLYGIWNILSGIVSGAAQIIGGLLDFIVGLFTGNGELIVSGLKSIFNGIMTILEGGINGLIAAAFGVINGFINGVNNIPGVNLPNINSPTVSLPRLAGGAVIPPNREFLAVLGDQRSGNNIEAPESLIRQIMREEMASFALSSNGGDTVIQIPLVVGAEELARATWRGNISLARRGEIDLKVM